MEEASSTVFSRNEAWDLIPANVTVWSGRVTATTPYSPDRCEPPKGGAYLGINSVPFG